MSAVGIRDTSLKQRTWEIISKADPGDEASRRFDILLVTIIALNVLAVILETVEGVQARYGSLLYAFELLSVAVFTIEYLARIWSITADPQYAHPVTGRLRWSLTPMALIDLFAILPTYLPFLGIDLRFLRALRLIRIIRIAKLSRYFGALQLLVGTVREKREELILTSWVVILMLILTASLMYYVENAVQPEVFSSIPETMWWAIVTLTTVGYGDTYPVTMLGRLLGGVVALLGIGLIALPTAILGSGFIEAIEREKEKRLGLTEAKLHRCPHCDKLIEITLEEPEA